MQAIAASVKDEDFDSSFVQPTLIDQWMKYLSGIRPRLSPDEVLSDGLQRNIGHRMQLLEFECALLLLNLETRRTFPGRSTLHETVSVMKMQQFSVLAHSVLEGIAGHLVRVAKLSRDEPVSEEKKIDVGTWRTALMEEVMASTTAPELSRAELKERLVDLTGWRDKLHLDRIEPHNPLHFNEFSAASCFLPAHQSLRFILNALNPNWPPETCLNEDLSSFT
ncbi:MAG: hypothetical protein K2W78_03415 [Xanthobacteraceae bacterium]|nr:hypothetical protein [Xanthobacteraceae bacterium]